MDTDQKEAFDGVNKKLDNITVLVKEADPSWWSIWWPRIKYVLIGVAWLCGTLTHKYGFYHLLTKYLE